MSASITSMSTPVQVAAIATVLRHQRIDHTHVCPGPGEADGDIGPMKPRPPVTTQVVAESAANAVGGSGGLADMGGTTLSSRSRSRTNPPSGRNIGRDAGRRC